MSGVRPWGRLGCGRRRCRHTCELCVLVNSRTCDRVRPVGLFHSGLAEVSAAMRVLGGGEPQVCLSPTWTSGLRIAHFGLSPLRLVRQFGPTLRLRRVRSPWASPAVDYRPQTDGQRRDGQCSCEPQRDAREQVVVTRRRQWPRSRVCAEPATDRDVLVSTDWDSGLAMLERSFQSGSPASSLFVSHPLTGSFGEPLSVTKTSLQSFPAAFMALRASPTVRALKAMVANESCKASFFV